MDQWHVVGTEAGWRAATACAGAAHHPAAAACVHHLHLSHPAAALEHALERGVNPTAGSEIGVPSTHLEPRSVWSPLEGGMRGTKQASMKQGTSANRLY